MEAARRRVRRGKEYDALFPKPDGRSIEIKKSADVNDTVSFIQRLVPQTLNDTRKVAKRLKGKTLDETCSNAWHFAYEHIPYKRDDVGIEQIRRPARSWWETREANKNGAGIDCDCYTVFLSSILMAMSPPIPHKYRITKYPKHNGETPYWQHIYIVVPKDGRLDSDLKNRDDYIVMDCVKDAYDEEEPYLERKDFNMRLDYLNGLSGNDYDIPQSIDARDMASIYDEEDLGKIKIGQAVRKIEKAAGKVAKAVVKVTVSPLRNAILLGMKVNLMNVGKRIRYAYLSDEEAKKRGMNISALNSLRTIKDKVENIYAGAGGKKENFRKAVLSGKGNRDGKVPLSGLNGSAYAVEDEYNIPYNLNGTGGLGVVDEAAMMALATTALGVIAKALSSVKGLFNAGSKEEQDMASSSSSDVSKTDIQNATASIAQGSEESDIDVGTKESEGNSADKNNAQNTASSSLPAVSNQSGRSTAVPVTAGTQSGSNSPVGKDTDEEKGIIAWAKTNPVLATGIVAGAATGAYLLLRSKNSNGLHGTPGRRKRKKSKEKKKPKFKAVILR